MDVGQDLTGGYYDAGDYLKFTYPLTFSLTEICYGGIEFFQGYVLSNQVHYLDQMVRWGMDWLIKANPNNSTLYVQVGISEIDNNYWGPDTGIPMPRPSFFVSRTKPGTDAFADAAAAFASCSILYRDKIKDPVYATLLQSRAKDLHTLAETALPQQTYQTVVPAVACCYASTGFVDELAWASAWMYRLTGEETFATSVSKYANEMTAKSVTTVVSWDDKAALVFILMAGLTRGNATAHMKWQTLAENFVNQSMQGAKPCAYTPGGMYYCYGTSGDDSSVVVANTAFAVNLLAKYMSEPAGEGATAEQNAIDSVTQTKISGYRAFALRQVRYLLGENPENTPYVVGVHPNSPINPHSALASGGENSDTVDTIPIKEAHVLVGALVGGPDKNDRFTDQRSNWRQNEVALDYNAPFTSLMAYQVMTSHDPPPYIQLSPDGRSHHHVSGTLPNGLPIWAFVLILVGILAAVLVLGMLIYRRKRIQIKSWIDLRREKRYLKKSSALLASLPGSKSSLQIANPTGSATRANGNAKTKTDLEKAAKEDAGRRYPVSNLAGLSSISLSGSEPTTPMTGGPMSSSDALLYADIESQHPTSRK
ncbi:hypothetical protein BGZ83_000492 [Gryganskiella cystojenkinii]|nr:hypothetical protein BGZ83_000492 [Gryganskiella cystojenkinii]